METVAKTLEQRIQEQIADCERIVSQPCNLDYPRNRCLTHNSFMFTTKDHCEAVITASLILYFHQPR